MLDLTKPRDVAIDARLREDLIVWLTTVRPDGRPHTVPVWFWWDGDAITIFCEPETTKIRNILVNPNVTVVLETRDDGEEVVIFEGKVELTTESSSDLMTTAYGEKYHHLFPRIDSNPEKMAKQFSQPVRFVSTKIISWNIG